MGPRRSAIEDSRNVADRDRSLAAAGVRLAVAGHVRMDANESLTP